MDEALFARLALTLESAPCVLASVLGTRGATPRKAGARMLIAAHETAYSVGGGLAEAKVILAARALLESGSAAARLRIDLSGGADAAGVCGGFMDLALRRWSPSQDRARAREIATTLARGEPVAISGEEIGADSAATLLTPNARLLIVGGGHCGQALYESARALDFDVWVFDPRADYAHPAAFPGATVLSGDFQQLRRAFGSARALYTVLLNRDFPSDVASLHVLAGGEFAFLGMMGSGKRIAAVRAALTPEQAQALAALQAPVGLPIAAETPQEIAVSVLAQLILTRAQLRSA